MSVDAWLLSVGNDLRVLAGRLEVRHLLEYPSCYPIPASPGHCALALLWEDHVLPVVDLLAWLENSTMDSFPSLVAVMQYYPTGHQAVAYGALVLLAPPQLIQVDNRQACELPSPVWRPISSACISRDEQALPILDLPSLFGQPHPGG